MIPEHHSSRIELSESALQNNLRFLHRTLGKNVKISSVIKGNAYGHGIPVYVPLAEKCGVDHFSVFSAAEAHLVLRSRTKDSHIMIMGDLHPGEYDWAITNGISFYVYNLDQLRSALQVATEIRQSALIHLELETGMNRIGLEPAELKEAVQIVQQNPSRVKVVGVSSHYAGAENVSNYLRVQNQLKSYNDQCEWIETLGIHGFIRHTASSSAALTYPETRMGMVRIGIAQYGFWPTQEVRMHYFLNTGKDINKRMVDPLKRILTWKSRIINIKEVGPGEFVGYGNAYLTTRKQQIAAVPVGYYHGFARNLSNLGRVLVNGKRAAVVGVVNMNMMLINVTDIKTVQSGDEVVIIGKQGKLQITVASFSDMTNHLNYEILVRLPEGIPRVVVS